MQEVNVTEFRNHLPKYLECVHKGSEILITSHGNVIARVLPPLNAKQQAQQKLKKLRKKSKVGDVVSPIKAKWTVEE